MKRAKDLILISWLLSLGRDAMGHLGLRAADLAPVAGHCWHQGFEQADRVRGSILLVGCAAMNAAMPMMLGAARNLLRAPGNIAQANLVASVLLKPTIWQR